MAVDEDENIFRELPLDHPLYKSGFVIGTLSGVPPAHKPVEGESAGDGDDQQRGASTQIKVVDCKSQAES